QRGNDQRKALGDLSAALSKLPGDPYSEPPGIVMAFDPAQPFRYGAKQLPTGNGLTAHRQKKETPAHGTVTLSAGEVNGDSAYVVFKVDGAISSIGNAKPFRLIWDTSKFPNGLHKIE